MGRVARRCEDVALAVGVEMATNWQNARGVVWESNDVERHDSGSTTLTPSSVRTTEASPSCTISSRKKIG